MYVALDIIFFSPSKANIKHISKKCPAVPIHLHPSEHSAAGQRSNLYLNQADADTRDSVTASVTLHCLCHSVSQGDEKLQHTAGRLPAQENLTTNTHSHITPTEVTTGVHMASMHAHTYAKTFLPSPVCCQDCFKHTHRSSHIAPLAPSNPPPRSKQQPPSGLVRANPAVDSAAPIAAPPPLRVVREMKALGVHYKTTTAAAGDRPPGAENYPFSSLHPHLPPLCPSISHPCSLRHTPLC